MKCPHCKKKMELIEDDPDYKDCFVCVRCGVIVDKKRKIIQE